MRVIIERLKTHSDRRGFVFEPIENNMISTQNNCHLVISEPGVIRGNHFHLNGTETIVVVGPAFLRFKEGDDTYNFDVPEKQVYKFIIPPKVTHAIKNIDDKDNLLIAFNTLAHDDQNPDLVSDVIMAK